MSPLRSVLLPLGVASILALAAPAFAAPTKATDVEASDNAAKARYTEGLKLYQKGRYEEARVEFLQANALKSRPLYRLMLGVASVKVGRWLEAVRELDVVASDTGSLTQKLQDLLESARREARGHVGKLRFEVPEGSEVSIDDQTAPSVREPVDVVAGKHVVVVRHRGETKTVMVEVSGDATVDVKPSFTPTSIVPTTDTRTRPTLPPAEGSGENGSSILAPPETTWPVWLFGAVGLGGLTTAAIFGGLTTNSNHSVDVMTETLLRKGQSRATCAAQPIEKPFDDICAVLEKNERLADTHQGVFMASLIVGSAATAIAVGWFFFAPKEKADKPAVGAPRVVPWVGAGTGGATMQGRF